MALTLNKTVKKVVTTTVNNEVVGENISNESSEVYLVVDSVYGSKELMKAKVIGYTNEDKSVVVFREFVEFPVDMGSNFILQAYTYLKTLEEFSAATDC